MATKVTFTLDDATIALLDDAAQRLNAPKSQVVRNAIADYHARLGQLSEAERTRMLRVLREVVPRIPSRSVEEVGEELKAIREARRSGGRRH